MGVMMGAMAERDNEVIEHSPPTSALIQLGMPCAATGLLFPLARLLKMR